MDRLQDLPLKSVTIQDEILNPYIDLVRKEIIPYQWEALNDRLPDAEPSHSIRNFKIAAGEEKGTFEGAVFQDSDVAKWLEAVAYSLETHPDSKLEQIADETVDLIGRAQRPDGYLNTYYILKAPHERWHNLKEGHELYVAGHMIEAAVAYSRATGKNKFLDIVSRLADLIADVFLGTTEASKVQEYPPDAELSEELKHAYPGHEEIELALIRLYRATGTRRYLDLAKHFVDVRGAGENYFLKEDKRPDYHPIWASGEYDPMYSQSHLPVREQTTAEGHAVRAVYLYSAMADLADECQDETLLQAAETLWDDMTNRRMYINGSIGSSGINERFTTDYDLPNDGNYSESCASVGLAMFGKRMAQITRDASYMDAVERALYNTVLAGIAADGKSFFYVNPMEVWPENCMPATSREHVKAVRQKWFGVACCPPNIARTLASFGQYVAFTDQKNDDLYLNLYVGGTISGNGFRVTANGNFPKDGKMVLTVETEENRETFPNLYLRIPSYAKTFRINRNGIEEAVTVEKHYAKITGIRNQDVITIQAEIPAQFLHANPNVRADEGKVALMKGPLLYCLEEIDNVHNLSSIFVSQDAEIEEESSMKLHFHGKRLSPEGWDEHTLYSTRKSKLVDTELTAVPYYSWGNRTPGEMLVWIRELL